MGGAIELLSQYDIHSDIDYAHHLAISDRDGRSVVVEWVDNEMIVANSPLCTNHYLAPSHKQGFSTLGDETYCRYDTMKALLEDSAMMNKEQITSAISRVAGSTTRWTAIFDNQAMKVTYYQNSDFSSPYVVSVVE